MQILATQHKFNHAMPLLERKKSVKEVEPPKEA